MIARIDDSAGRLAGVHRTWLERAAAGRWVRRDRAMLGRTKGGAVRLGPPAAELMVAEGIETAASAMMATTMPAWAALSAGGLECLVLPPLPLAHEIVVLADNDRNGRGEDAAHTAAQRWLAEGRRVRIAMPATVGSDWNDVLRGHPVLEAVRAGIAAAEEIGWADPDLGVLRLHRRPPPAVPLAVFGQHWPRWIADAADAAACPPDYVVLPLLAAASALIGNARWASGSPGWAEPPHLWVAAIGDSGTGKSPGADCLMRDVLPEIERRMLADFPDQRREWRSAAEAARAAAEAWQSDVRLAHRRGVPPPDPPSEAGPEPQAPRLRQNDVTIEKVASLLATAAPKGLLVVRDELAGWVGSMSAYNDAGRQFWLEAYGGRPYRVERQKNPEPIIVPRLAVAVYGGTQPDRLARLMREPDDGLLARFLWAWPDPVKFNLTGRTPDIEFAIRSLDRLRLLELHPAEEPGSPFRPIVVPLAKDALPQLREFGREAQKRQERTGGPMRSAWGKARGQVLRLALVLELLWWSAVDGATVPPREISLKALAAAAVLLGDYFAPMAERAYGDAGCIKQERNAATLAQWITDAHPDEVYVRHLQRDVRLPGLTDAESIHEAALVLVEADWLCKPAAADGHRRKEVYPINPRLWQVLP